MGSYAKCWLGDLYLGCTKNSIDADVISLFRKQDKKIKRGQVPYQLFNNSYDNEQEIKYLYYEAPIKIIRDRLELFGYDLPNVKEAFYSCFAAEKERNIERITEYRKGNRETSKMLADYYEKMNRIIMDLTPEEWIENIFKIRASRLEKKEHRRFEENTIIDYMLTRNWYGYAGADLYVPLRLILEDFESEGNFLYDLTELVLSEYFEYEEDFVEFGTSLTFTESQEKSKTIVLTEGKTDAWILDKSLDFLYPHLRGYFSFLDFESTGFGGGVGNLVNIVKAFSGAGVLNNVIALFDNDTAALSAVKSLKSTALPSNVVVRHLPIITLLQNYPTIGPSGLTNLDINGIAASIELYLGEDVLKIDGHNFVPIQWTGFDKSINRYQGEVLEKKLIHDRFSKKLKQAKTTEDTDWQDLRAIFQVLFTAFSKRNRETILGKASSEYFEE